MLWELIRNINIENKLIEKLSKVERIISDHILRVN